MQADFTQFMHARGSDTLRDKAMQQAFRKFGLGILLFYLVAIFFLERIGSHARIEDFLTPLLAIAILPFLSWELLKISAAPATYFLAAFVITAVSIIVGYLPPKVLLIWGKEFQYFLAFMLFVGLFLGCEDKIKAIRWVLFGLCAWGVGYALFAVLTGDIRHYGLTYFTERDSPSLSAWIYINLFVAGLILRRCFGAGKWFMLPIILLLLICVVTVGTRTGDIALLVFLTAYALYHVGWRMALGGIMAVAAVAAFMIWHEAIVAYFRDVNVLISAGLSRAETLMQFSATLEGARIESWQTVLSKWAEGNILFGCGRGCSHLDAHGNVPSLGLGADNQYTVNLLELGVFGSALFLVALGWLVYQVKQPLRKLYAPYVLAYLAGGMAMEIWQLSKPGQLFWLISGVFIVLSRYEQMFGQFLPSHDGMDAMKTMLKRRRFRPFGVISSQNRFTSGTLFRRNL